MWTAALGCHLTLRMGTAPTDGAHLSAVSAPGAGVPELILGVGGRTLSSFQGGVSDRLCQLQFKSGHVTQGSYEN